MGDKIQIQKKAERSVAKAIDAAHMFQRGLFMWIECELNSSSRPMSPTQSGSNRAARWGVIWDIKNQEFPGIFFRGKSLLEYLGLIKIPLYNFLGSFLGTVRSYLPSFTTGSFLWTPFIPMITFSGTLKSTPNGRRLPKPVAGSQTRFFSGDDFRCCLLCHCLFSFL